MNDAVRRELLRAWTLFDPEEYARIVLSGAPGMDNIMIDSPGLIPGLPNIPQLNWLQINFREGYGNLRFIRTLPRITLLNIMSDPALRDLTPLIGHRSLESVNLHYCGDSIDLAPLATIPKLRNIFFHASQAANIEALRDCEKIERISINELESGDYLLRLLPAHSLQSLLLDYCFWPLKISDLPDVPALSELQFISLRNTPCTSIRGIGRWAESLKAISLGSALDLGSLTELPNLSTVYLSDNAENDLNALRALPSLREIYLSGDSPVDLTGLLGIRSTTIYVGRNREVRGAFLGEGSKIVHR